MKGKGNLPELFKISEIAEWLDVHPDTVQRAMRRGELNGFRLGAKGRGGDWRVSRGELERFCGLTEDKQMIKVRTGIGAMMFVG